MPQSLAQVWIHLIFSTKNRFPFLSDQKLRTDMRTLPKCFVNRNANR